ncbi:NADPH-dependent FMN reductase [Tepidamorphus sp. 3E244]|uniref:NADPH-dependent FMN reductase n=1 Tax=Tepidamorphus sp. 3E244 TaxID=3385498 RepID=UPI0038FC3B6F
MKKIAVIVGSNRKESINRKLAEALGKLAEGRLEFVYPDIEALPMFNDDLVENYPASARAVKDMVESADGVILVTPEYNRSIPALLKNAIDWLTRPVGENSWNGKPGAFMGTSPGKISTMAAQMHLRDIMVGLGLIIMGRPEMLIQMTPDLIDDDMKFADEDTRKFFNSFIDKFDKWIDQVKA